jgi:phospholipase C
MDNLKHLVVLMMENRPFHHMLGGLKKNFLNGLAGTES